MSQGSLPFDFRVYVIDTNAVIDIKLLPITEQWPCCNLLQVLVDLRLATRSEAYPDTKLDGSAIT